MHKIELSRKTGTDHESNQIKMLKKKEDTVCRT